MLFTLAKLESCHWLAVNETLPPSASAFVSELEIYFPMAGFINTEEEKARLQKEISKQEKDLAVIDNKLKNPQFVDKAPAEVVTKERTRQQEIAGTLFKLRQQLEDLSL